MKLFCAALLLSLPWQQPSVGAFMPHNHAPIVDTTARLFPSKLTTSKSFQRINNHQAQNRQAQSRLAAAPLVSIPARKSSGLFVGQLWPILRKFMIGPDQARKVASAVLEATLWQDVLILLVLGYLLPYVRIKNWTKRIMNMASDDDEDEERVDESGNGSADDGNEEEDLSMWGVVTENNAVSKSLRSFARVSLLAYIVEVICIASKALGFKNKSLAAFPGVFAKLAYSYWAFRGFLRTKRVALCRIYKVDPENMGKVEILDRLSSGVSAAIYGLICADWLSVKMGLALKGILTFGSVGTLAFGFASKDLASQLVSGLMLSLSNKVTVGESVEFSGNGPPFNDVKGKIVKLGWMETVIRESDSRLTTIPNSLLGGKKISNLSRVKISQVTQTLKFAYDQADKMPALVDSIRQEIKKSCPKLILNGFRPFRVHWTGFNEDHLEVSVNCHFYIPPGGDKYWENRQNLMMAINRAVNKHTVAMAMPADGDAAAPVLSLSQSKASALKREEEEEEDDEEEEMGTNNEIEEEKPASKKRAKVVEEPTTAVEVNNTPSQT